MKRGEKVERTLLFFSGLGQNAQPEGLKGLLGSRGGGKAWLQEGGAVHHIVSAVRRQRTLNPGA